MRSYLMPSYIMLSYTILSPFDPSQVSMTVLSDLTTLCGYLRLHEGTGQCKRPTKWWCVLAEGKLRLYKVRRRHVLCVACTR
jgi:hypothetical protein